MERRGWYSSGKERTPGNLFKYTIIVLVGVVFAGVAIFNMLATEQATGSADIWGSLLWALIFAAGTAVVGVVIWYLYKALVIDRTR